MLNSEAFAQILVDLAKCYDRVIIYSPPVIPVADSQIIAARCDIVLLVVRADKSTRRLIQHARDNLVSVGGHLLGVVVNDVARRHGRYGYYGGYYRGYGHGGYSYKDYGYASNGSYYGEDTVAENRQESKQDVRV